MSTVRAIALDFDGVVLESAGIKTEAFRCLFPERSPEEVAAVVAHHLANEGVSRYRKFRHFREEIFGEPYTPEDERDLDERFSALVREGLLTCPFVPGARELLESLSGRVPLYVVSGTPDAELAEIAGLRGVAGAFTALLGSSRAKPERLREVLEREGIEAGELLFVGDAMTDWRAADEVGAIFVGRVRPGEPSPFPQSGVAALVDDMTGVAGLLEPGGPFAIAAA